MNLTNQVNIAIHVYYRAVGAQSGITDLTLASYNPSGTGQTPVTMTEVGNGLYQGSFTPNVIGRWRITITSATYTENAHAEYYFVTNDGNLNITIPPSTSKKPVQIVYDKPHTAINVGEWQDLCSYTVPTGYNFEAISAQAASQTTNEKARVICRKTFASYNSPTSTFTDGASSVVPQFASRLYLKVTAGIGSSNGDVTVTYTNSEGVTGRTAVLALPKSVVAGTRLEILLQNGDIGVRDITNVTYSATGQAGAFDIYGLREFFFLIMTAGDVLYQAQNAPAGSLVVAEGETIYLQYKSSTKSTYTRRVSLVGTLSEV